jgi:hypothetical protein
MWENPSKSMVLVSGLDSGMKKSNKDDLVDPIGKIAT